MCKSLNIKINVIPAIPAYELEDKLKNIVSFIYSDIQNLHHRYEEKYKDRDKSRLVNYRCNYYQREVLEITFMYKNKLHYCQIDEVAGLYIFDTGIKKEMSV